jgi:OmpA-OmpF porin, OOP family
MAALPSAVWARAQYEVAAPEATGWYFGLAAGPNWQEHNHVDGGGASGSVDFKTGWVALGSLGYSLGNGLRFEIEPGFRRNGVDHVNGGSGDGRSSILTVMANGIYDLPIRTPFIELTPHIGAGIGAARV